MNQYALNLIAVLAFCLGGCAKSDNPDNNTPQTAPKVEETKIVDLSNKSLEEVLALKYNKAVLTCKLWSQRAQEIDLDLAPNVIRTWDLKAKDATFSSVRKQVV